MLMPKRVKYRRPHRLSYEGLSKGGTEVAFGEFGLIAMSGAYISNNQIEAARVAMTRHIKRGGKVWIKIFPDKPITEKPAETRMGSGKGSPEYWVAVVKPGRVMFEIGADKDKPISQDDLKEALRLAMHKLPIKCKIVAKADQDGGAEA
jgi:large subunit ribosomal protein L16